MTMPSARSAVAALAVVSTLLVLGCGDHEAEPSRVVVRDSFTAEGTMGLAVYLDVDNQGGPDAIVGARLLPPDEALAGRVTLHRTGERDGLTTMEPTEAIELAGTTTGALGPAEAHIMLEDVDQDVAAGRTIALAVELRRGDDIPTEVQVVTADEAVQRLSGDRP